MTVDLLSYSEVGPFKLVCFIYLFFFPKGCVVLALTRWNIAVVVLINCFNGDMIAADLFG